MITVDTKLIALLGNPLRQSFSNILQNETYKQLELDYYYFPIETRKENGVLEDIVKGIRRMNFAGFACTKPDKEEILKYIDETDDSVEMIGSCNTVVVQSDGALKGYNTDGIGCLMSLEEETGENMSGKTFFSIGAGGTGKAVCFELARAGAKRIYISSRSDACEKLSQSINSYYPNVCIPVKSSDTQATVAAIKETDIILNLSGIGMYPHTEETPIEKGLLQPKHICFDATYNPEKTKFLLDAEEQGCRVINGLGMLAYQGARQVKLWAGIDEPKELMMKILKKIAVKSN